MPARKHQGQPALSLFAAEDALLGPGGPVTVQHVLDCYTRLAERGASDIARLERVRVRAEFATALGSRLVSDCRGADLLMFLRSNPAWQSDWTLLRVCRTIQRPFNWAVEMGLCDRNPFTAVKIGAGKRGRQMTDAEYLQLVRASRPYFRRVLLFLRLSGARPGELRQLRPEHVDLVNGRAVLWQHKTAHSRRDGRPRVLVLHPVLVRLLRWIIQQPGQNGLIFLNARGRPWTKSAIDLNFYQLRKRVGIDPSCKLYGARHAFGTRAAAAGVPLPTLAELMGHTSVTMVQHYVHAADDHGHLAEAVRRAAGGVVEPK